MTAPHASSADRARPALIRATPLQGDDAGIDLRRLLPAWITSGVFHVVLLTLGVLVGIGQSRSEYGSELSLTSEIADDAKNDANLDNENIGDNPDIASGFALERIGENNLPGPVNPNEMPGLKDGRQDITPENVPPPPGYGQGPGSGIDSPNQPGTGNRSGEPGGMGGQRLVPGGVDGRSGLTKQRMLDQMGGNPRSEAAVALGLLWLARHQALDGHWGLHDFHIHGKCGCGHAGAHYDVAGTGLALLALQGAGQTHRGTGRNNRYMKEVERALKWLIARQGADGSFSSNGYEHAIATIAFCEAYGLTADPVLRGPAQRAVNACVAWQHTNGGFRYAARTPGDLSVGGWFIQALKSGSMAGLNVPNATFAGINNYLDSVSTPDGAAYGYQQSEAGVTMTPVGLLGRQYMGWGPRNPGLVKGTEYLRKLPPSPNFRNIYYYYYATQVMYHMAAVNPEGWDQWNRKMRDLLIDTQDQGLNPDRRDQKGSWSPEGDKWGGPLGRLGYTSLALLTLEVYYRHLPLYRRELGVIKPEAQRDGRE